METPELDDLMCIEVEINSVEHERGLKSSIKCQTKRRDFDVCESTPKKLRSGNSPYCDAFHESPKHPARKKKPTSKSKKNDVYSDPIELKNVLEGMDDAIDNVLEETAQKNRLTPANVKNILRHVITNEYVLAMVRNTMKAETNEGGEFEEAVFEPKLTRSKVKELREKQHMLPWPMSSPVKQAEPETKALLEEEFPDESSSDEDYKPNEEECLSEEDKVGSPKSGDLDSSICEKALTPITKPEDDDDIGLVIAVPESEPDLVSESASMDDEVDKIALRTRSKLPLNDTPLEAIEASFVAPDITVDMYDTQCDDEEWQKFLRELTKPLEDIVTVEKPDGEHDDAEEDPEYNALEDEDIPDDFDLRYDNTMKVTRKELNALMAEIYEYDQSLLHDIDEDEEETEAPVRTTSPVTEVSFVEEPTELAEPAETIKTQDQWMPYQARLQLEEQLRMYVQIITQSYLLSFGIPELNFINISNKLYLDELKYFAIQSTTVNEKSAFYAHNLDGALDIVKEYETNRNKIHVRSKIKASSFRPGIAAYQVKKTLFCNKVFMYPELLPVCGFNKDSEIRKAFFLPSEDNLISLGLEQFSFAVSPVNFIQTLLVPCKTEEQIAMRIKNVKSRRTLENPIKYFFTYNMAPPFPHSVKNFDPNNVKAPKDHPPEVLPRWMRLMLRPITILPKERKSTVSVHPVKKLPPKRRLRKLLPKNVHFSPLKQISPILKKYSQQRLTPSSSTGNNSDSTKKTGQFAKRPVVKPSLISPKPANSTEYMVSGKIIENNNLLTCVSDVNGKGKSTIPGTTATKDSARAYILKGEISKKTKSAPNTGINDCDGHTELDECDEEIIDDEPESSTHHDSTLSTNTINKKHAVSKKKNKQQRDLESSLFLLQPRLIEKDPKREEREDLFATSYLLRVTEALGRNTVACENFFKILSKSQHNLQSPVKLYLELRDILKDFPALADDFIAFLNPEQAKKCGKYKEFLLLKKIRSFIRKVEVHFQNQPQHLLKILKTLAQYKQQSSITSSEILGIMQPLLKSQTHLMEELSSLLPDVAPCQTLMIDFEEVTIPNSDDDNSSASYEEITIPEVPDLYGGKDCPCECHTSSTEAKVLNKIRHCVKCGVKFIDGKIYIQTGKVLKPAQVIYQNAPPETVTIPNGDTKAAAKNKQSHSLFTVKHVIAPDHSSKPEVSPVKKDHIRMSNVISIQPVASPDEPVPSTSKLPCDVIEDTVFPSLPVESKKTVPPDFSHLKDVIGPTNDKNSNIHEKSSLSANITGTSSTAKQLPPATDKKNKWTRDQDKLIIYNCQRFGVTEKAFKASSAALKIRTPEEVQERFVHLMDLLSQEFNIQ